MKDCLFCRIIDGEIPSNKVYEDDEVVAFRDIAPKAPVHVLIVPREHVSGMDVEGAEKHAAAMFKAAREIAKSEGLGEKGFRAVINCGKDACQSVQHLHMHILGGKQMNEDMA